MAENIINLLKRTKAAITESLQQDDATKFEKLVSALATPTTQQAIAAQNLSEEYSATKLDYLSEAAQYNSCAVISGILNQHEYNYKNPICQYVYDAATVAASYGSFEALTKLTYAVVSGRYRFEYMHHNAQRDGQKTFEDINYVEKDSEGYLEIVDACIESEKDPFTALKTLQKETLLFNEHGRIGVPSPYEHLVQKIESMGRGRKKFITDLYLEEFDLKPLKKIAKSALKKTINDVMRENQEFLKADQAHDTQEAAIEELQSALELG